jgi:hypothetical protein
VPPTSDYTRSIECGTPRVAVGALDNERGARCVLSADHLIGRAPEATLRVQHPSVSWRHASLRWTGSCWELQDLGSLNGTFLDAVRVEPGGRIVLAPGARMRFGDSEQEWVLVCDEPWQTALVALEDGRRTEPHDGIIVLPDAEQPELSICCQADGNWIAETADHVWELERDQIVTAGGRSFRFEPGAAVYATSVNHLRSPRPSTIALEFVVSRNEEHVELTIVHADRRTALRPRAHTYLLLTLARLRMADQASELPASSHGWVAQQRLLKMLATNPAQLALDIYRARRQFAEAGVLDAVQIIERRPGSRELRIGVEPLAVQIA